MNAIRLLICPAAAHALFWAAAAHAGSPEQAARSFAEGNTLLAKGDFEAALNAFLAAAREETEKVEYRQQYAIVRQIIQMRQLIAQETDPDRLLAAARALHAFYHYYKIYGEALALDRRVHTRFNSSNSAAMLAETQLAMGRNAEAAELLSALDPGSSNLRTSLLLGIALGRQGKTDQAKVVAERIRLTDSDGPGLLFDFACLRALIGDFPEAIRLLTRCFELTPPSRLEEFKAYAKEQKDLATLAGGPEFTKALQTQSRVRESACSGGSACGRCPNRTGCPTTNAAGAPKQQP